MQIEGQVSVISFVSNDFALAFCQWNYLGYFTLDPQLRDTDRFDNPARTTYGYCDRGYVLLLLVFCALIYVCVVCFCTSLSFEPFHYQFLVSNISKNNS